MPALRFKTCRLLEGNVWNRELTIIQRRILRRLRNKTRSIKRMIYSRKNLNSYIQLQTTRKLPLFRGDLPITEMHRGTERTSYIPFPLNPETRPSVVPVRLWSSYRFGFSSSFHISLIFWKQKMLQLFPIPNMSERLSILVLFFFYSYLKFWGIS